MDETLSEEDATSLPSTGGQALRSALAESVESAGSNPTKTPKEGKTDGRLWTKDFLLGTMINFLLMVNYYSLMVVITSYSMKTYGASASAAGLAASIFIIGALVSRIIVGSIMDRIGRKRILMIGIVVEVVCSTLYLLDIGFAPLFALRFAHGFSYGCCSTTIGTVATALVPANRKGEGVGYYMLSTTLGAAIGPFLGMFLSQNIGYTALFAMAAIVAVAGMLSVIGLKTPEIARKAKRSETRPVAKNSAQRLVSTIIEPSTLSIGLSCGVLFFCYSSLLTFLTPFAEENGLTTASSFFFVAYAAATFVTRPFTGRQFDRKGDRFVMIPAFISFTVGMMLLANVSHPIAMLVAAALMGYGAGTVQSSALALAVRMAPPEKLSLANSTFYALLDVGVGIGPLVLGAVEPFWGYRGLFLSMAVLSVVALAIYLHISRKDGSMRKLLDRNS